MQTFEIGDKVTWKAGAFTMSGVVKDPDGEAIDVKTHYRDDAIYISDVKIQDPRILTKES